MSAPQKRGFVAQALERGLSERRACRLVGQARSVARYQARPRRIDEAALVERLKQIARKKRRRGYRLAYRELRRQGWSVNHKRVWRLWKRERLSVPPRKSRKRVRGVCAPRAAIVADRPNAVWCLDFVEDRTLWGGRLRILCVTDEFTRESLAIEVGRSFRSEQVGSVLDELIGQRGGVPTALRMDNGPEFVALALRGLCHRRRIDPAYIKPGKPWHNGFAESFHARLRDEFLDGEAFVSILDAQVRLGVWRRYYNEERLHSSLDYQTPSEFAFKWAGQERTNRAETKAAGGPNNGG